MGKLTDGKAGTIARAEAPAKGQRFIFDDHRNAPRGFALRITAAGGRAFVLQYSVDGRQHRKVIGAWPTWTLEAARAEAQDLVRKIDTGHDPLKEKRRRKEEPTMAELAAEWLDKHASGLKSVGTIRGLVNNDILPALGDEKVTDIRRRDIIEMVEAKAAKAPRSAAQLLVYVRKIMTYAADREIIAVNPVADLKPTSITVKGQRNPLKANPRDRVLTQEEIRSFWQNAETSGLHRLTALALKMTLVTGQRPGEVVGMREDEIDGRWWIIPASRRGKTSTAQAVYLTDTALRIIADAKAEIDRLSKRRRTPHSGFIFEASPGKPIGNDALARAVARAGDALGDMGEDDGRGRWRPHDLRRTMRTGLSAAKVGPDIAEIVTGHVIPGIRGVYDRHDFKDERRMALEAWERRLMAIVAGDDPDAARVDNVIMLEGARA
ncbi:MAG: tyrosine-type recombinase/integrase [Roseinatronobacter sp.]